MTYTKRSHGERQGTVADPLIGGFERLELDDGDTLGDRGVQFDVAMLHAGVTPRQHAGTDRA